MSDMHVKFCNYPIYCSVEADTLSTLDMSPAEPNIQLMFKRSNQVTERADE